MSTNRPSSSSRRSDQVTLRRLLSRRAIEGLLAAAGATASTKTRLALVETDGTAFVGGDDWLAPLGARLRRALRDAREMSDDAISLGPGAHVHPLRVSGRVVGGLVVGEPAHGPSADAATDGCVPVLRSGLTVILGLAAEARELGRETLDRYRELSALYRIGETVGASLDPAAIPSLLLREAARVVQADAGAIVIGPDSNARPVATIGQARIVGEMVGAARGILEAVTASGLPRIATPPAFEAPRLAAVVCVPIRANDRVLGAMALARGRAQPVFSAGEERLLVAIASEGAVAYDRALLHEERIRRERADQELAIGRRIQLSLLPSSVPTRAGWEFSAVYEAAQQVGGDFYDFIEPPGEADTVHLVVGDVTGKGVPAALMMASTRTVLRATSGGGVAPSVVLERTNEHTLRDGRGRLLVTALYGTLELSSGRFVFASAGHDPPLLVAPDGRSRLLMTGGVLLGAFGTLGLVDRDVDLAPGALLVLYTDGITEARDGRGRLFGERRFRAALAGHADTSAADVARSVLAAVRDFAGGTPPSDDLTLVVVKRGR